MKEKFLLLLLSSVAVMPLPVLYILSDFIYLVLYYIIGYRKKVVFRNLSEAFPKKSAKEIKAIAKDYYRFLCDVIVETVKLLHISDKKLAERVIVSNPEIVNDSLRNGKNAVLMMGHYGNWEWVQEISRYFLPGIFMASIYHPLRNKFWDDIYLKIRNRWGNHIIPQRKAMRQLIDKDHRPWVCGFIADQRTWDKQDKNCTLFLNHNTYFIFGPEELGEKLGSDFFYMEMSRPKRGHYIIIFHPISGKGYPTPFPKTRQFWHEFEETIKRNPALWLWSHKRWA